jgi:hypothetical protein
MEPRQATLGISPAGTLPPLGMLLKREGDRGPAGEMREESQGRSVRWRSRAADRGDDRAGVGRVPSCSAVKTPFKKYPIINRLARQTLIRDGDAEPDENPQSVSRSTPSAGCQM